MTKKHLLTAIGIFTIVISLAALMCSCSPEYTGQTISYLEETSSLYAYGEKLQTKNATYVFEHTLSEEKRNECIDATKKVLNFLKHKDGLTATVFEKDTFGDNSYVKENELFTCDTDFESTHYISLVVLAIYGRYCNYGLAYGYADYIADKLGYGSQCEESDFNFSDKIYSDLNLLCFLPQYTTAEDIKKAQYLSCTFVKDYIKKHGQENFMSLLKQSSDVSKVDETNSAIKNELAAYGVDYTGSQILYTFGGHSNEFCAKSPFAEFYINDGWTEYNCDTPVVDSEFLHEDYNKVKDYFHSVTSQMAEVVEFFAFDDYDDSLKIIFQEGTGKTSYYRNDHTIILRSIQSMIHEFTHSVTEKHCKPYNWAAEGLSRYTTYLFDDYSNAMLEYYLNTKSGAYSDHHAHIDAFRKYHDRDIDVTRDYIDLANLNVYINDYFIFEQTPSTSGESFIFYLEKQYGTEKAIAYCLNGSDPFADEGKTLQDLHEEWKEWLKANYSVYFQ